MTEVILILMQNESYPHLHLPPQLFFLLNSSLIRSLSSARQCSTAIAAAAESTQNRYRRQPSSFLLNSPPLCQPKFYHSCCRHRKPKAFSHLPNLVPSHPRSKLSLIGFRIQSSTLIPEGRSNETKKPKVQFQI